MSRRGQALIETALALPVLLVLGLGAVATIRIADAQSGLTAACISAVSVATRAPDAPSAIASAGGRFQAVTAAYPLVNPRFALQLGNFGRGTPAGCEAAADVDLSFAPVPGWASRVHITARAGGRIDDWRSRP